MSNLKCKTTVNSDKLDASCERFTPKHFFSGLSAALNQQPSSTEVCSNQANLRFLKSNKTISSHTVLNLFGKFHHLCLLAMICCSVITDPSLGVAS